MQVVGAGLGGLWALEWTWHIRVTHLRCVQNYEILKSQFSIFDCFRDIRVHIYGFLKFVGVENFFLGQSIGIEENNTFQLKFVF